MGTLTYGEGTVIEIEDRSLLHLQIVIGLKLRRREGFFFSLKPAEGTGQRISMWLDPSIPLVFSFDGDSVTSVNKAWLEVLTLNSNSAQGLKLVAEDSDEVVSFVSALHQPTAQQPT